MDQTPIMVRYECPNCGEPLRGPRGKGFVCPICGTTMRHPPEPALDAEPQSLRDPDPKDPPAEPQPLYAPGSLPLYPLVRIGVFLSVAVSIILILAGIIAMLEASSRLMGLLVLLGGICGLPGAELLQLMLNVADDIRKSRLALERLVQSRRD